MSFSQLNKQIEDCSREMDRQRHCVRALLVRQRSDIGRQAQRIPLPVTIGLALLGGFLTQRLLQAPSSSQLFRFFLAWRL